MKLFTALTPLAVSVMVFGCSKPVETTFKEPLPDVVDFNYHVKPILSDTCYLCHGPDKANAKANLTLSNFDDATNHKTDNGLFAIVPGDAHESEAFLRIMSKDENFQMPPPSAHLTLSDRDKAMIGKWIEQGAEYKKHWALIKPTKPALPKSSLDTWPQIQAWANNEIDLFIGKNMVGKGFLPNEKADKESLIRRLSFDLTGLPPTIQQIDNFLADNSEQATDKLIDQLLASPHFGERLAVEWLDVARYADTHGYSTDYYRDMSPYRDWVIDSFNKNRPFDEFITWQLAGDLFENPTQEQLLATAFNRIHAQNGEGGIVNEEFRVEYVKDRVQTVGTGLLGLTMHCAQCHDHKYDPISTKDYYSTFAFFNSVDDTGQISYDPNDMPVPTMTMATAEQSKQLEALTKEITQHENKLEHFSADDQAFTTWQASQPNLNQDDGSDALVAHFPFDTHDTKDKINSKVNNQHLGKVMFGAQPEKTIGPDLTHLNDSGHSSIKLNGDDALYFPTLKGYHRAQPFTLSIEASIPDNIEEAVLVHYNKSSDLYNYKGFDIGIENNHWIVRFAHTYPYNAIKLISTTAVTRNTWQHITLSYDGSSKSGGITLFLDGQALAMNVERDNLYKETEHTKTDVLKEIGIKIGARWRSKGLANALVDNFKVYGRELTAIEVANSYSKNQLSHSQHDLLALFNHTVNPQYQQTLISLQTLREQHNKLAEALREVMIMQELPTPRQAYVLNRGSYANQGEPVQPGVPEAILPFDNSWPKDRRGLAKWLTSANNPLVARVVINRYWQMMFGQGLVRTPEDFGNQGKLPTHPKLLDWLAVSFIESGWDVKHMIKLIASSAAYQQSSKSNDKLNEVDPENVLYARGPKSRLTAEMIRDNALFVSELLVDDIGGKSVKPYQPKDIWKMNNMTYQQGQGDELYRRSMYTIYKRSAPPPNMTAFDSPSRSHSVGTRQQTNTPLQALALLNDPQMIESARVLAFNVMQHASSTQDQLQLVYRQVTGRKASVDEVNIIEQMYQHSLTDFENQPEQVAQLMAVGEHAINTKDHTPALAALSSVANMLMNHDAAVIKR